MRLKTYLKGLGLGIFVTALIMSLGSSRAKGEMTDEEIMARAEKLGMVSENSLLLSEAKQAAEDAGKRARDNAAMQEVGTDKTDEKDTAEATSIAENGEIIKNDPEASDDAVGTSPQAGDATATASEKEDRAGQAGGNSGTSEKPANTPTADNSSSEKQSDDLSSAKKSDDSSSAKKSDDSSSEKKSDDSSSAKKTDDTSSAKKTDSESSGNDPADGEEIIVINVNSGESSLSVASEMVKAGLITDARQFDSYLVLSGYDRHLVVGSHPIPKGASAEEMGKILTSKQ
ncbi:MAG: hypothetical protein K6E90_10140 [Lachnospiraceae bacterium]|nr:hypothetical protein [Lachnospiraceae bacterium]